MASVIKYDNTVTINIPGVVSAIKQGYFYTVNTSGQAILADNGINGGAIGFAAVDVAASDIVAGMLAALPLCGVIEYLATDIVGTPVAGGYAWLGAGGKPTSVKPATAASVVQPLGTWLSATRLAANVTASSLLVQVAAISNIGI